MIVRCLLSFCLLTLLSCSSPNKNSLFEQQQSLGSVSDELREASGLVASISNPGYLWSHNDGNNSPEIFLINEKAEIVMTCELKNVRNRDWEDITIGPGPEDSVNYLYVADIGDNHARYRTKRLYRFKEPTFSGEKIEIEDVHTLRVKISDGPRDSEAIMVDPISKNFYIVSKRERSVGLYEIKFPFKSDTLDAVLLDRLPFTDIVAANISPDGSEVLLKSYRNIYYWQRKSDETILETLQRMPVQLDYDMEPQGESIAWKTDGSGFYTLSESKIVIGGNLYFYKRR
jgi:hypothetical protein